MIKIAVITRKMIMGGVERTLISLLQELNKEKVEIDLYVQEFGGELEKEIPENVSKFEIPKIEWHECIIHRKYFIDKVVSMCKLHFGKPTFIEQCWLSSKMYKDIEKEYDIAISYHAPNTIPVFYTIDRIKAKKKILWLHGNLTSNDGTTELALSYYQKYDTIFAVAEFIKKELITYLPQKKNSMRVFYNYFYPHIIEEKSLIGETFCDQYEGIRILTVARFDKQKGLDMAVNVCEKLIKDGYFIRWYVCGDGEDKEMIEQMVYEKNLQADFIFLGNKNNPYGYMRACDLYVQPSRCEGYCTTTNEAKALKKPIITTNVSGAQEQFVDNVSGWIVGISEVAIYEKIKEILEDKSCLKRIADNLKKNLNILQNDVCEILGEYGGENDSR